MKTMAEVLDGHTLQDGDSCSCYDMFYDTRMTATGIQHEHSLHVEKELMDAGFGLVKEAQAGALRDAANDPEMRLSGHSGISISRLRARAASIEADQ